MGSSRFGMPDAARILRSTSILTLSSLRAALANVLLDHDLDNYLFFMLCYSLASS